MEKDHFGSHFALRLKTALLNAGLISSRSTSGVDIHKLVEITGYSSQICRKYLKGQAIPEPFKLHEIAAELNVSPGWLLFGDATHEQGAEKIVLGKTSLRHIFHKIHAFETQVLTADRFANFMTNLCSELESMDVSADQSLKIIDLAFSSLQQANPSQ